MSSDEIDPLLSTFVIEERLGADGDWYSTEEAAALAARVSVQLHESELKRDPALVSEWLASGHRKHLRRAKPAQFEKLIREVPGVLLDGPHGRLFATTLHRKSETPALVSKLQLSHFKSRVKEHPAPESTAVEILLNENLGMSFGKAVIAAAHVAQAMLISLGERDAREQLQRWEKDSYQVSVRWATVDERESDVRIVDHGLTEVPSGSVTALARWNDSSIED